jgi:hypothetical protein
MGASLLAVWVIYLLCAVAGVEIAAAEAAALPAGVLAARGESVIECPSPLNVLNHTYDHSCY